MADDLAPLLHTIRGSAGRLGVSESTVWRLLRIGKLRTCRVLGRTMISEAELQRFAREAEEDDGVQET
jgi:excisionase family DNA binding protein